MPRAKADTVLLSVRLERSLKERLERHAAKRSEGNASELARKAIAVMVQYLDRQEGE